MKKIPKIKNEITKCECDRSSVEFEPIGQDLYDLSVSNCGWSDDNEEGYRHFVCGFCGNEIEKAKTDISMIGDMEETNSFIKKMGKGISDMVVKFDLATPKDEEDTNEGNKLFVGSDDEYNFYINKNVIEIPFTELNFDNYISFQEKLGKMFTECLEKHGETTTTFSIRAGIERTRTYYWEKTSMPMQVFMTAMAILGEKVDIANY